MGLMGTLAKVAIGYAAARGVDHFAGSGGLGTLLGGDAQVPAQDPNARAQAQMVQGLSGAQPPAGAAGNPLADMMAQMSKGGLGGLMGDGSPLADMMQKMQAGAGPQMEEMMAKLQAGAGGFDLSQMFGAAPGGGSGGGKPGLLSQLGEGGTGLAGLLAMASGAAATAQGQGAGQMIDAMQSATPAPEAEEAAGLMLRAMIQAAKSDGDIDASERAKILETLGPDADPGDVDFIKTQLAAPVDPDALAAETPEAQRMQVYSASLMTIRVDTQAEAQYLHRLASAMGLQEPVVNALHMQMGMKPLYA
ncbi:DUF533 domain-containing protein [Cognatishimia sp. F0-27]|uniref:DUF533 domain-containing protein n=1 Tax=Cognatishimia sp. F0-27 TaxID=2816855 RepID=UPI001D0C4CA8|nr:DUF533 domain-containing protein [Cognatishimia sp. F0-27]MCC1494388.1 DUF533 domain-containing protein [Cognatishimia sp. F0-27]